MNIRQPRDSEEVDSYRKAFSAERAGYNGYVIPAFKHPCSNALSFQRSL